MKYLVLCLALMGCTDEKEAVRVLRASGYSDIVTLGYEPFMCGNDNYSTGFRAKNPLGQVVNGAVCCNPPFKGCTVRY